MFEVPKAVIQQKYEASGSLEELLSVLSEGIIAISYTIFSSFNLERKGSLIWKLIKAINRKRYDKYVNTRNTLLCKSIAVVINSLRPILTNELTDKISRQILDEVTSHVGYQVAILLNMSEDDSHRLVVLLRDITKERMQKFIGTDYGKQVSQNAEFLLDAYGKQVSPKELGKLMNSLLDPWVLLYPYDFINRYRELEKNSR